MEVSKGRTGGSLPWPGSFHDGDDGYGTVSVSGGETSWPRSLKTEIGVEVTKLMIVDLRITEGMNPEIEAVL